MTEVSSSTLNLQALQTAIDQMQSGYIETAGDTNQCCLAELETQLGADAVQGAKDHIQLKAFLETIRDAIEQRDDISPEDKKEALKIIDDALSKSESAQNEELLEAVSESPVGDKAAAEGASHANDLLDEILKLAEEVGNETAKNAGEGGEEAKGRNWLETLALELAKIQNIFLSRAMDASTTMAANAGDKHVAQEGETLSPEQNKENNEQRAQFLNAQASYTANMQMFTTFSNQVSTSIKSVGEALAGISRKQ